MKKFVTYFLLMSVMLTWNCPSYAETSPHHISSRNKAISQDIGDDEIKDDYINLNCNLRPIERKSANVKKTAKSLPTMNVHWFGPTNSQSLNWSGYFAVNGTKDLLNPLFRSVTFVKGTWVIPRLTASEDGDTFSSAWIGIDGYSNGVVEQIGTGHDVIDGEKVLYAWFELYPADAQVIEGFPVAEGDTIEGSVSYLGQNEVNNDVFKLVLKNHTRKVKFSIEQATLPGFPAHLSSAEWIAEAPVITPSTTCFAILPLANFGSITFTNCSATINGITGSIGNKNWTCQPIDMISTTDITKAVPSSLTSSCKERTSSKSSSNLRLKKNRKKDKGCKADGFQVDWENSGPFPFDEKCTLT